MTPKQSCEIKIKSINGFGIVGHQNENPTCDMLLDLVLKIIANFKYETVSFLCSENLWPKAIKLQGM